MNKSPNCLKVILNSKDGTGVNYNMTFKSLTEQNDIIYNEFFNHIRKNNLPLKLVLTGCITTPLDYWLVSANPYDPSTKNPYYVRVQFNGITPKNEISPLRSTEFIVPTTFVSNTETINSDVFIEAYPVIVQWMNLPKSNKNIGAELNDYSVFTAPINIRILDNLGNVVSHDPTSGYAPSFTIEFWLFVDE